MDNDRDWVLAYIRGSCPPPPPSPLRNAWGKAWGSGGTLSVRSSAAGARMAFENVGRRSGGSELGSAPPPCGHWVRDPCPPPQRAHRPRRCWRSMWLHPAGGSGPPTAARRTGTHTRRQAAVSKENPQNENRQNIHNPDIKENLPRGNEFARNTHTPTHTGIQHIL